jgi:hypothetical protein
MVCATVPKYKSRTDNGKHDGSGALEYQGEARVWCPKGVLEAEQAELDTDQKPADGSDHEPSARHHKEQSPPEREHYGQNYASDSLE